MATSLRNKQISFGELFCGAGGLSLGAQMAADKLGLTIKHRWAVDQSADAIATYSENFDCERPIVGDIRKIDLKELAKVDGLAFGFPCNDFSLVGEHKGVHGAFGPLYKYCVEAVRLSRPVWFVAENVGGIRSANGGLALPAILSEFAQLGYRVTPHFFKFELYGVPQARHRVLIVGLRTDTGKVFGVPKPAKKLRTARAALEQPPIPADSANHELTKQSVRVVERLTALRPGQNAFASSLPKALRLNVRGAKISQIYRRLDPDKPAYTVTGSGGGGTHVYHWAEPRALTNRERARLQTFPDSFVFSGGKESVRKQIGMAVPPEGAEAVLEAVFKTLLGVEYETVPSNLEEKFGLELFQPTFL